MLAELNHDRSIPAEGIERRPLGQREQGFEFPDETPGSFLDGWDRIAVHALPTGQERAHRLRLRDPDKAVRL